MVSIGQTRPLKAQNCTSSRAAVRWRPGGGWVCRQPHSASARAAASATAGCKIRSTTLDRLRQHGDPLLLTVAATLIRHFRVRRGKHRRQLQPLLSLLSSTVRVSRCADFHGHDRWLLRTPFDPVRSAAHCDEVRCVRSHGHAGLLRRRCSGSGRRTARKRPEPLPQKLRMGDILSDAVPLEASLRRAGRAG